MRDEGVFDDVVYPYTEHAKVDPEYVVSLTISSFNDENFVENMAKAVAIGSTFFLLSPVMPVRYEIKLGVQANVVDAAHSLIGTYAYNDIYELKYTTLTPNKAKFEKWIEESIRHVTEKVIEKMQQDEAAFRGQ